MRHTRTAQMRLFSGTVIKDGTRRGMYATSPPWWLKLGVLLLFYQQHPHEEGEVVDSRRALGMLLTAHAVLSLAALLPSCLHSVRSRARTTWFTLETVLMLTALAVLLIIGGGPREHTGALALQMALVHAQWSEARALRTQRSVLLWQDAACRVRFVTAALTPLLGVVFVPRPSMDSMSAVNMLLVLFTGEALGLGVACVHAVLDAAGRLWEAAVWD